ncbi:MAG: hypothetical protein ACREL2_06315, partial [Gemmatimonadales bacterium]
RGASMVLLADAPGPLEEVLRRVARHIPEAASVLLFSEVHSAALAMAASLGLADRTAALHPMGEVAGPGFQGASPHRFHGRITYVSAPDTDAGHRTARSAMSFIEEVLGGAPVLIDPLRHDEQIAWTRQLPGVAMAVLGHLLDGRRLGGVTWDTAARLARQGMPVDPVEASEVILANRVAIGAALEALAGDLDELRRLLLAGDAVGVRAFFEAAARFRPGTS